MKDRPQSKKSTKTAFIETASGSLEEVEPSAVSGSISNNLRQGVHNWIDRVNGSELDELDELFGKCFNHKGIPFRFANSPSLGTFVKRLRPAYQLPSAKMVAGSIFQVHQKFKKKDG